MKQIKSSCRINTKILQGFNSAVTEVGLRRDTYLNRVVPDVCATLRARTANSPTTLAWLRDYYGLARESSRERPPTERINITLDESVFNELNEVCQTKRVPRDLVLEKFFEQLSARLRSAANLINDPLSQELDSGLDFTHHILLSDAEREQLENSIENDELLIQAIANKKGISLSTAQKSYEALDPEKKSRLAGNPAIVEEMVNIKTKRNMAKVIDLADLLDNQEKAHGHNSSRD